jgi:hypothetical protein
MATAKKTTKKAFEKKAASSQKLGHFNITVYKDETAGIDVDCPTSELIATLASIIASEEGPGQLLRSALALAAFGLEEESKKKKKKPAVKKKAAPKKKK